MKQTSFRTILWVFFYFITSSAYSQSAQVFTPPAQQYDASFIAHPQLYNGPEYVDYAKQYFTRTGHQYFLSPEKYPGSVYYNNHLFSNITLQYDIVLDQLIIKHPTSPLTLRLINDHIRSFTVDGHHFIRLVADSSMNKDIRTGNYEVLSSGSITLLAKRIKRIQEEPKQGHIDAEFISNDKFYLKKDSIYFSISSKSHILHALSENKEQLSLFMQKNKLKFKKKYLENSLTLIASYYNTELQKLATPNQ